MCYDVRQKKYRRNISTRPRHSARVATVSSVLKQEQLDGGCRASGGKIAGTH